MSSVCSFFGPPCMMFFSSKIKLLCVNGIHEYLQLQPLSCTLLVTRTTTPRTGLAQNDIEMYYCLTKPCYPITSISCLLKYFKFILELQLLVVICWSARSRGRMFLVSTMRPPIGSKQEDMGPDGRHDMRPSMQLDCIYSLRCL